MIFHGGRVDLALVAEMTEVMRPLLLEMGRLAIERCRPEHLEPIRRLRHVAADERLDREERYTAIHELFVFLADMATNRVWQILARRLRALFRQEPLRVARQRFRRDPGRFVPLIDDCLAALASGRKRVAIENLQRLIGLLGDMSEVTEEPVPSRKKEPPDERLHPDDADPGAWLRHGDERGLPVELRLGGGGAPQPLREGRRSAVGGGPRHPLGRADRSREVLDDSARRRDPNREVLVLEVAPAGEIVELTRRTAAFRLSQFLHGEQGALMVAAQLVNAVPHTDAKFYAATQTMDEARHVEVFARYIEKLDEIRPIAPSLKGILDQTLATGDWMKKLVGMQIVVEGLALYSFREMRNLSAEPLLRDILTYVARDESRHHAYGVQYIERCVPCLSDAERVELEDFALECARSLIDRNAQASSPR